MRAARRVRSLGLAVVLTVLAGCSGESSVAGPAPAPTTAASPTAAAATSAAPTTTAAVATSAAPTTTVPADQHTAQQVAAARTQLAGLKVGGRGPKTGYVRTQVFGPAWADVDANGCDTRNDILARDLTRTVRRNRCVITAGTLADPYTGRQIDFSKPAAAAVQIDHVVPLSLAWQLGAAQWSQGKRVAFANDPAGLLAVDGPSNSAKGDAGPDGWLPPNKAYRCTYAIRFTRVASAYDLRITPSIKAAIETQLDECPTVDGAPAELPTLPASSWPRAAGLGGGRSATTPSSMPASDEVYFASCADARKAGRAPLHRGDPGYRAGLDRDGDGTACE